MPPFEYSQSGQPAPGTAFAVDAGIGAAVATIGGQRYAALPIDANGDVIANLVPRTGLLADLLALGGSLNEIAIATDVKAVVRFTGVAGQAVVVADGSRILTITVPDGGTGVYTPAIPIADYDAITLFSSATPGYTSVNIGDIGAGTIKVRLTINNYAYIPVTFPTSLIAYGLPAYCTETYTMVNDGTTVYYVGSGAQSLHNALSVVNNANSFGGRQYLVGLFDQPVNRNSTAIGIRTRARQINQEIQTQLMSAAREFGETLLADADAAENG